MLITRLLMAAVLTSAMFGQSNVGEISGQVSDPTGAAIPGCVITATHTQTGLKRTIETAETGVFVFAGLPEGKVSFRQGCVDEKRRPISSSYRVLEGGQSYVRSFGALQR